eukprot:TRINITY_DN4178_c0_g1_i1.p1 TRINITY_DN4178_c0_g1~~TRINITY_DN4178_c0_g1_i1.p1  ORF type:complete len:124 (+),score=24.69 TRINITY_DN4178_c0_g1_i1:134-505(+)
MSSLWISFGDLRVSVGQHVDQRSRLLFCIICARQLQRMSAEARVLFSECSRPDNHSSPVLVPLVPLQQNPEISTEEPTQDREGSGLSTGLAIAGVVLVAGGVLVLSVLTGGGVAAVGVVVVML